MKKTIALLVLISFAISCTKPGNADISTIAAKQSSLNNDYKKMVPFTEGNDALEGDELELWRVTTDSLINSDADCKFYDSKFSADASPGLQQHFGYIVLSKKDIIGLAAANPSDVTYQEVLTKYTTVLVKNKYIGYCVLYSALKQSKDTSYKKVMAKEILNYAKDDTFYNDAVGDARIPDSITAPIKINYAYLDSLKVMAE
jgi:hypothetical protein